MGKYRICFKFTQDRQYSEKVIVIYLCLILQAVIGVKFPLVSRSNVTLSWSSIGSVSKLEFE